MDNDDNIHRWHLSSVLLQEIAGSIITNDRNVLSRYLFVFSRLHILGSVHSFYIHVKLELFEFITHHDVAIPGHREEASCEGVRRRIQQERNPNHQRNAGSRTGSSSREEMQRSERGQSRLAQ